MIKEEYFEEFPHLETERLFLREFSFNDAPDVHRIRTDEKIMNYMDTPRHNSIEDSRQLITKNKETYRQGKGIFWVMEEKSTHNFIGDIVFKNINKENHRAEIGYALKPHFWGLGYMKEAMIEVIKFGFHRLNCHSLEANINPNNDNSKGILLKMGFKKEAFFRENHFYNGKYLDSEIYSLLEGDFEYN